jgi:hypothetical protein
MTSIFIGKSMDRPEILAGVISNFGFDVAVWSTSLFLAIMAGGYLFYRVWNREDRNLKAIWIFSGSGILVFMTALLMQAPLLYLIHEERLTYDDFTMYTGVFGENLYIDGMIGPSFAGRLRREFEANPGIRKIHITSFGGLVDQALEAAELIETKGNITVIARELCDSACIMVLMAGDTRLADREMKLGFHSPSPIIDLPERILKMSGVSRNADRYLISKGVPPEILAQRNGKQNNLLVNIPARHLARIGVIDGFTETQGIKAIAEMQKYLDR